MPRESFGVPIKAENLESHEDLLGQQLLGVQLELFNMVRNKKFPVYEHIGIDASNVRECLEFSGVLGHAVHMYDRRFPNLSHKDPTFKKFINEVLGDVTLLFNSSMTPSPKQIFDVMRSRVELTPVPENVSTTASEKPSSESYYTKERNAGLIYYKIAKLGWTEFKIPEGELYANGETGESDCAVIHFRPAFQQKYKDGDENKNIFSSKSLEILAEQIATDTNTIRYVLGRSWMIDTPIARKIGFHTDSRNGKMFDLGFTSQFVDQNGQIDKSRVEYLLNHGIPPYVVSNGYIHVEEFLKKHLPEKLKQGVVLKKENPSFKHLNEDVNRVREQILLQWENLSAEMILQTVKEAKIYNDFIQTDEGKKLAQLVFDVKNSGGTVQEFQNKADADREISDAFVEFSRSFQYVEYAPNLS